MVQPDEYLGVYISLKKIEFYSQSSTSALFQRIIVRDDYTFKDFEETVDSFLKEYKEHKKILKFVVSVDCEIKDGFIVYCLVPHFTNLPSNTTLCGSYSCSFIPYVVSGTFYYSQKLQEEDVLFISLDETMNMCFSRRGKLVPHLEEDTSVIGSLPVVTNKGVKLFKQLSTFLSLFYDIYRNKVLNKKFINKGTFFEHSEMFNKAMNEYYPVQFYKDITNPSNSSFFPYIEKSARYFGIMLASIVSCYNPTYIILDGCVFDIPGYFQVSYDYFKAMTVEEIQNTLSIESCASNSVYALYIDSLVEYDESRGGIDYWIEREKNKASVEPQEKRVLPHHIQNHLPRVVEITMDDNMDLYESETVLSVTPTSSKDQESKKKEPFIPPTLSIPTTSNTTTMQVSNQKSKTSEETSAKSNSKAPNYTLSRPQYSTPPPFDIERYMESEMTSSKISITNQRASSSNIKQLLASESASALNKETESDSSSRADKQESPSRSPSSQPARTSSNPSSAFSPAQPTVKFYTPQYTSQKSMFPALLKSQSEENKKKLNYTPLTVTPSSSSPYDSSTQNNVILLDNHRHAPPMKSSTSQVQDKQSKSSSRKSPFIIPSQKSVELMAKQKELDNSTSGSCTETTTKDERASTASIGLMKLSIDTRFPSADIFHTSSSEHGPSQSNSPQTTVSDNYLDVHKKKCLSVRLAHGVRDIRDIENMSNSPLADYARSKSPLEASSPPLISARDKETENNEELPGLPPLQNKMPVKRKLSLHRRYTMSNATPASTNTPSPSNTQVNRDQT